MLGWSGHYKEVCVVLVWSQRSGLCCVGLVATERLVWCWSGHYREVCVVLTWSLQSCLCGVAGDTHWTSSFTWDLLYKQHRPDEQPVSIHILLLPYISRASVGVVGSGGSGLCLAGLPLKTERSQKI